MALEEELPEDPVLLPDVTGTETLQPSTSLGLRGLFRTSGNMVFCQFLVSVLTLALSLVIARRLGPSGNGVYALALFLPNVLSTLWNLGIVASNSYFIASGEVTPQVAVKTTAYLGVFFTGVGALLTVPVLAFGARGLFPDVPTAYLWWMLPLFSVSLIQTLLASVFLGVQQFRPWNIVLLVAPFVNLVFAAIFLIVLPWKVAGALEAFACGQVAQLAVTWWYLREYMGDGVSFNDMRRYTKLALSYGLKAHLSNIVMFLNYRINLLIVGKFLLAEQVGLYSVGLGIAERCWLISFSVSSIILPRLSELNQDEATKRQLTPIVARWVLIVTGATAGVLILAGKPLIIFFFGIKFAPSYPVIVWMLPGIVVLGLSRILSNDIAARGRIEINLYVSLVDLAVNTAANWLLVPRFGIVGCAAATTGVYTLDTLMRMTIYSQLSGNDWWRPLAFDRGDWSYVQRGWARIRSVMAGR